MVKTLCRLLLLLVFLPGPARAEPEEAIEQVRVYHQARAAEIVGELREFLRLPNVATNLDDMRRNAAALKAMMEQRAIQTEVLPTAGGPPIVFGELAAGAQAPTVLFYCHYDGQAVDPAQWHSEPFEPVLRPAYGGEWKTIPFPAAGERVEDDWRLFARSAADDKAPIVALLAALDALKAQGLSPRLNLKFLFDGEEEQGSPHLAEFTRRERERLRADLLIVADGPIHQSGRPTIFYGARGIMTIDLTVYGPTENLHSGHYGNWAPNPAMHLAQLLATMKDEKGRVTIQGFYDDVEPLSEKDRQALAAIPPVEQALQDRYGIAEPEGEGKSLAELVTLPSLNVRGLASAWVGAEARTIIPRSATAALDVRLVKGNDHEKLFEKIVAHIRKQGWHVVSEEPTPAERRAYARLVRVVKNDGYNAVRTPTDHPLAEPVARAVERATGEQVVKLPTLGGSGPVHYFDELGIPSIGVPIVNFDNNQHGPDENLRLGNFFQGIEIFASTFLWE